MITARPNGRPEDGSAATGRPWRWLRLLAGAGVLAVLVWQVGTGPFLHGIRSVDATAVALAVGFGAVTTLSCAWRWRVVAAGLGIELPIGAAVAAYYRAQFLNATLPGGVLGDVHRGVSHGRELDDVGRGLRAVAWERSAGLVALIAVTLVVTLALPSPGRSWLPAAATALAAIGIGAALAARAAGHRADRSTPWRRIGGALSDDLRNGVLARSAWPRIAFASTVATGGLAATFLVAASATGSTAPAAQLLPIGLLVVLSMGVPLNVGGWGPREGVAAWAFAAADLGAAQGVATATAYGVLSLAATLPGAAVLVGESVRRRAGGGPGSSLTSSPGPSVGAGPDSGSPVTPRAQEAGRG